VDKGAEKKSIVKKVNASEDEKIKKVNRSNLSEENEMSEIKSGSRSNPGHGKGSNFVKDSKGKQIRKYE